MNYPKELKEPKVLRIFFSSPFNGMEIEREELTKRYWPRIQSLCNVHGLQFRAVDMRWGITSQSSDAARVIQICLAEAARSDIFVGFYGQRYGWHGENDKTLQKNFDNALPSFPWIDKYRDRSVTELEFLAGHLNNPGKIPACLCFRDKKFDDKKVEEAERVDKKAANKWKIESEVAELRMNDLKRRVKETEDAALGVDICYKTPEEGAKFMFDCIWKHLNDYLLIHLRSTGEQSRLLKQLTLHSQFTESRSSNSKPICIVGESGIGKSALLSNWKVSYSQKNNDEVLFLYHFGCAKGSTSIGSFLATASAYLNDILIERKQTKDFFEISDKKELVRSFQKILNDFNEEFKRKPIIIIDGLDKLEIDKSTAPFFWFQTNILPLGHFILSTNINDSTHLKVIDERGYDKYEVSVLSKERKQAFCTKTLKGYSKEFSESQLNSVVEVKQTENPLYLKVFVEEICSFGYFRLLDEKISDLLSASTSTDLFEKVLIRLEADYNDENNPTFIQDALCSLLLTEYGLSEKDILDYLNVDQHVWVPFFFSIEKFLIIRNGMLQISINEFGLAIKAKYCPTDELLQRSTQKLAVFLYSQFEKKKKTGENMESVLMDELPLLLMKLNDKEKLLEFVTTENVINYYKNKVNAILEFFSKFTSDELYKAFSKFINNTVCYNYIENERNFSEDDFVAKIVYECKHYELYEIITKKVMTLIPVSKHSEDKKKELNLSMKYDLGCIYCDCFEIDKSIAIHKELLEYYESINNLRLLQQIYHALGTAYINSEVYDEAEKCFDKCLEILDSGELNVVDNTRGLVYSNLGLIYQKTNRLEKAYEMTSQSIKIEEEYYFGDLPLSISHRIHNLAIIERKRNNLDEADKLYLKSFEIIKNTVGENSIDAAMIYQNRAVVEGARENPDLDKCHELTLKNLEIMEKAIGDNVKDMRLTFALENMALNLFNRKNFDEMETYLWRAVERREINQDFRSALSFYDPLIIKYVNEDKEYTKARRLILNLFHAKQQLFYFLVLYLCDKEIGDNPERPYEMTLEYASEKYPTDMQTYFFRLKNVLIPEKAIDKIIDAANRFYVTAHESKDEEAIGNCPSVLEVSIKLLRDKELPEVAEKMAIEALKHEPENKEILNEYAITLESLKKKPDVLEVYEKLFKMHPETIEFAINCCKYCCELGKIENAEKYLADFVKLSETNTTHSNLIPIFENAIKEMKKKREEYEMSVKNSEQH
ncbi:DgyrCDS793 [Dimorphilus gyrociliatus]|uniref:DgyrCDS793 n=1 Tax=Dimorphilus gyrociliatus TaxID=2664684 RepID=A0A7I8V8G2_9ANNE|nr:DgyrCDS793 [Dimorphilus gyrociliatus]